MQTLQDGSKRENYKTQDFQSREYIKIHVPWGAYNFPEDLVQADFFFLSYLRLNRQALANCSLVAKSWTYSSQKPIYSCVYITPYSYQKWRKIASPTSARLLHCVYSLTCLRLKSLYHLHGDFLKLFDHLQHFTLDQVHDVDLDAVNLLPAFQNTLSSPSLLHSSLILDAFIKLLGYFPNLREFSLTAPTFYAEHRTVPPPTPLRGTLRLSKLSVKDTDILLQGICGLELEYKLEIYEVRGLSTFHVYRIISACEKTLARLMLGN